MFEIESGREAARKADITPVPNLVALDNQRMATTGAALDSEPNHDIQVWRLKEGVSPASRTGK